MFAKQEFGGKAGAVKKGDQSFCRNFQGDQ